jgi:hypothetical protein
MAQKICVIKKIKQQQRPRANKNSDATNNRRWYWPPVFYK